MAVALIFFATFVFALLYIYKLFTPTSKEWKYGNEIPGPKPLAIFGNGLILARAKNMLDAFCDLRQSYGSTFRLWLGKQLFVVLSDPNDIEAFLSSSEHLNKSNSYRMIDPWLGDTNLITSDADIWRIHRKQLTPSFHFKILENAVPAIAENARILCKQLQLHINQSDFNIMEPIEKCSLDIICETAMGTKLNTQTSSNSSYLSALKKVCDASIARMFFPWLHPYFLFRLSKYGRIYSKLVPVLRKHCMKVILERKAELEQTKNATVTIEGSKKPKPFLNFILEEANFTDEEIVNEVQTFMFAGHDTTSTTLSFCLYALSNDQRVQEKVVEELKSTLLNKEGELTYRDYMNLKYLELVIKETLRYYPSIPMIARKVHTDFKIPSGYVIPANSLVNFFLFGMHKDEELFPDSQQFLPERFEDVNRHPYSFVPFSAGPRNCIGQKFAMIEIKVVLSHLLLKYRILPSTRKEKVQLDMSLVLRSLNEIPIRITTRDL